MRIQIKQNWANSYWWTKPVDARAHMVLSDNHMNNQMLNNQRVAEITGRKWLQQFMHGQHSSKEWHEFEVPASDALAQRAAAFAQKYGHD